MMDKMRMETADITALNIEKIGALFPNCVTETLDEEKSTEQNKVYKKAVNFELLKQMLSKDVVDGNEAYEFTWVGKKASIIEANKPIRKTLRPCKEESVNWDKTENLYIEGDNLEVLKLLQESYLGKVKMIYIDPPYNTGNDFIYNDVFKINRNEYANKSGEIDETGNRMFKNTDNNGRFHSDWCSMIYPRLMLARNLLSDDGVIFITLDDGENANCRKMCNEIFGEANFITEFIWEKKKKPSFLHRNVGKLFDYILCYAKNIDSTRGFSVEKTTEGKKYPINNAGNGRSIIIFPPRSVRFAAKKAIYEPQDMSEGNIFTVLKNTVIVEDYFNQNEIILDGEWRYSQDKIYEIFRNHEEFVISKSPFRPNHVKSGGEIKKMKNILSPAHYGCETNEDATKQIIEIFGFDIFDTPKPVRLIKLLIEAITYDDKKGIILDFFSGSSTTAHAVMAQNLEDGGNRKFIMVQLPEKTDESSEAYKAGYKNICEIGKERIRRAGKKILEENKDKEGIENLDIGFRALKLDDTNMRDVYYSPSEYSQDLLSTLESNVKSDRSDLDLLFGCLLEWGLPLSLPYACEKIGECTVHNYNDGDLIACFDENIAESVIKEIAKKRPLRAVFRDSSFANSPSKINVAEIFKLLAPDTRVKVI